MKKSQVVQAVKPDVIGWVQGVLKYPITTQEQITTPTTPDAGQRMLYARNDGFYQLTAAGVASRLALASEIPTLVYPDGYSGSGVAFVGYTAAGAIIADNGVSVVNPDFYGGAFLISTAASAENGAYYILNVPLRAGTYVVLINYAKLATSGCFDLYVNGTKVSGETPLDTYAASNTYNNAWTVGGIVIATDGYQEVKIVTNGKNASSSDYRLMIGGVAIHRRA